MRRRVIAALRCLRADDGLTSVEYAVLLALILGGVSAAAYTLGESVREPAASLAGKSEAITVTLPSSAPMLVLTEPVSRVKTSLLPWALISITLTIGGALAYIGFYYALDAVRHQRTRQKVRALMSGEEVQAALKKIMTPAKPKPVLNFYPSETRLLGPRIPNIHRWPGDRDMTAELTGAIFTPRRRRPVAASATLEAECV
jgi:Flp pilus assembly pilin Flp